MTNILRKLPAQLTRNWLTLLLVPIVLIVLPVQAADEVDEEKAQSVLELKHNSDYSDAGADSCVNCHDAESDFPATKIFMTAHGNRTNPKSPMAQFQCEACHGPGGEHTVRRVEEGEVREPMIDFKNHNVPVGELNQICSSCHKSTDTHWQGSTHEQSDVACSDCHVVHESKDIIKEKHNQVMVCGACHQEQKLATKRFSRHPLASSDQIVGQGQMGCTDCHSSHGSFSDHMLVEETVNDTCFQCHAEKRGPFVWEHEPVTDSCETCHTSHGSNQPDLLVQRAPFLCQSCHSSEGHPALAYDRPGASPLSETMMLGRSCSSCHSQVHGSNHPAGSLLQRQVAKMSNQFEKEYTKQKLVVAIQAVLLGGMLALAPATINAKGFEAATKQDVDLSDYECEDCPEVVQEKFTLVTSLGFLDDTADRFSQYSGLDSETNLFLSGEGMFRYEDGYYWNIDFHNLGLDSGGLSTVFGQYGNYKIGFSYQGIPGTLHTNAQSAFIDDGYYLRLNPNWVLGDTTQQMTSPAGYNSFDLETDWKILGLNFDLKTDAKIRYQLDYKKLNKEGHREYSVAQMLNAAYIPLPVDNETEDLNASISWMSDDFYGSVSAFISRFNNNAHSVAVQYPFNSLISGSSYSRLAMEPQNSYNRYSVNMRYRYMDNSYLKLRYSSGTLTQDEPLLEYSMNPAFQFALPVSSLDAEVSTTDFTAQLIHKFSKQWRLNIKYRDRERDNKTDIYQWERLITDLYVSGNISNVPYDYSTETLTATLNFTLTPEHRMNVAFHSQDKERNFQQVTSNSEDGYEFNYHGRIDDLTVHFSSKQSHRDSSEKTLIDYFEVTENPLLDRYNVAERDYGRFRLTASYPLSDALNIYVTATSSEQDYRDTQIGLNENNQQDLGIDLAWQVSDTANMSLYFQEQKLDTSLSGSTYFAGPDWMADTDDDIQSYGLDFKVSDLNESGATLRFSINQSDASTNIVMNTLGQTNSLPEVVTDWTQAEIQFKYPWSENLDLFFTYQYQDFHSDDYALNNTLPGQVDRLLTLGRLNDQYQINYVQISAVYRFDASDDSDDEDYDEDED